MANSAAAVDDLEDAEISIGEEKLDQSLAGTVSESDEASHKKEDGDDDDFSKKEEAAKDEKEEKIKKELPKKTKVVDWPLKDIAEPHPNDVLYGRGGECNACD
jgi:hypothetical protein